MLVGFGQNNRKHSEGNGAAVGSARLLGSWGCMGTVGSLGMHGNSPAHTELLVLNTSTIFRFSKELEPSTVIFTGTYASPVPIPRFKGETVGPNIQTMRTGLDIAASVGSGAALPSSK